MLDILKPDFEFADDRGQIVQLVRQGFSQINIVTSFAGHKRGGHFHRFNKEAFYVIDGNIDVVVEKNETVEKYSFRKGDMFIIHPKVVHYFTFLEDTILIGMYDKGIELENGQKDIVPV